MRVKLNKNSEKPLYIQLFDAIAEEIRAGRLHNGTKLPPRREMAAALDVSANTVDCAYKMLLDTGYVISIPRRGYIVSFKSMAYESSTPWELAAPEEIVFSPNGVDFSYIDRSAYAKIVRSLAYNDGAGIFSYVSKSGEDELRSAISKYLYSFRGIKCSPDMIIIGAGAEYLLTALTMIFPREIPIIMENPYDPHFYHTMKDYGREVLMLPASSDRFGADALLKAERGLLFIDPYSRFPRGKGLDKAAREAIIEWLGGGEERYVVENGERAEISPYSDEPLVCVDKSERTIYLGSFAKSLCPSVKTSYMVLPEKISELWKKRHTYYYALTSKLEQYAVAEFVEKGHFTKHYKMMKRIYKDKLDYLIGHLRCEFGSDVEICDVCGTYMTVRFKNRDAEKVKRLARGNGVRLMSLNSFCEGGTELPVAENKVMFGIGDLRRDEILRGVVLLKRALELG